MFQYNTSACRRELTSQISILQQWFSHLSMHWNYLEGMLKCRLLGPIPRVSGLQGLTLGWGGLRICISNIQKMLMLLVLESQFGNHCPTCITNYNDIIKSQVLKNGNIQDATYYNDWTVFYNSGQVRVQKIPHLKITKQIIRK